MRLELRTRDQRRPGGDVAGNSLDTLERIVAGGIIEAQRLTKRTARSRQHGDCLGVLVGCQRLAEDAQRVEEVVDIDGRLRRHGLHNLGGDREQLECLCLILAVLFVVDEAAVLQTLHLAVEDRSGVLGLRPLGMQAEEQLVLHFRVQLYCLAIDLRFDAHLPRTLAPQWDVRGTDGPASRHLRLLESSIGKDDLLDPVLQRINYTLLFAPRELSAAAAELLDLLDGGFGLLVAFGQCFGARLLDVAVLIPSLLGEVELAHLSLEIVSELLLHHGSVDRREVLLHANSVFRRSDRHTALVVFDIVQMQLLGVVHYALDKRDIGVRHVLVGKDFPDTLGGDFLSGDEVLKLTLQAFRVKFSEVPAGLHVDIVFVLREIAAKLVLDTGDFYRGLLVLTTFGRLFKRNLSTIVEFIPRQGAHLEEPLEDRLVDIERTGSIGLLIAKNNKPRVAEFLVQHEAAVSDTAADDQSVGHDMARLTRQRQKSRELLIIDVAQGLRGNTHGVLEVLKPLGTMVAQGVEITQTEDVAHEVFQRLHTVDLVVLEGLPCGIQIVRRWGRKVERIAQFMLCSVERFLTEATSAVVRRDRVDVEGEGAGREHGRTFAHRAASLRYEVANDIILELDAQLVQNILDGIPHAGENAAVQLLGVLRHVLFDRLAAGTEVGATSKFAIRCTAHGHIVFVHIVHQRIELGRWQQRTHTEVTNGFVRQQKAHVFLGRDTVGEDDHLTIEGEA